MAPSGGLLASSHHLKETQSISAGGLVVSALAASIRRLNWPAPFIEERWLEILLVVTHDSFEFYKEECLMEGRKRAYGLWKASSLPLPDAGSWACDFEEGGSLPAVERPCPRGWSVDGVDWCEEAGCPHCEGRVGPPGRVLTCPLPAALETAAWKKLQSAVNVRLFSTSPQHSRSVSITLERSPSVGGVTACTHALYGLAKLEVWRPGSVEKC